MKVDGQPVNENSLPIGFDESNRNVIIYSDDRDLDGEQKTYEITAVFVDPEHQAAQPAKGEAIVDFQDPCYERFTLVA
jgi:hypothetical protein